MLPVLFHFPAKAAAVLALVAAILLVIARSPVRRFWPGWGGMLAPVLPGLYAAWIAWSQSSPASSWIERLAGEWSSITVYSYPALLLAAFILGWVVLRHLALQQGLVTRALLAVYLVAVAWSIVGGRALYILTIYHSIADDGLGALVHRGGMVAYGGMIAGTLAGAWACWRRKIPFLQFADVAAPVIALGTAVTRMGCFLFGCDFGAPSDLPWAVRFPAQSPAWVEQVASLGLPSTASQAWPVHPTQLYEAFIALGLFGLLWGIRNKALVAGLRFAIWAGVYGATRAGIELVRGDSDRGSLGPLSTSQAIGLATAVLALLFIAARVRSPGRAPSDGAGNHAGPLQ